MKIIHITPSYKPAYIYGGPIRSVAKLCETIKKLHPNHADNVSLEVFTTTANGAVELRVETNKQQIVDGVSVSYFKRWTKDHSHFSPGLLRHLITVLRQAQHDNNEVVIHIHAWWNLVSVFSCLAAKWYKVPVVLSPRGMLTKYSQNNRHSFAKTLIHHLIGKSLLQYCHIHATSEQEKEEILKMIQAKSINVIPNLVNIGYQLSGINYQDDKLFKLVFLSRIEEKKGLELLFEALVLLKIQWELTIAGAGEESYIESLKVRAEKLKLDDRINWVGEVSNEDKFDLMVKHHLLVLPSYNENFANVVVESLSVGTPVLVSDQVGLAEYVEQNNLGWVCSLKQDDIVMNIKKAFQDQIKRKKIRNIAPTMIREDFSDRSLIIFYMKLYHSILGNE